MGATAGATAEPAVAELEGAEPPASDSSFLIIITWGGLRRGGAGFGRGAPGDTGRAEEEGWELPVPAIEPGVLYGVSHCKDVIRPKLAPGPCTGD